MSQLKHIDPKKISNSETRPTTDTMALLAETSRPNRAPDLHQDQATAALLTAVGDNVVLITTLVAVRVNEGNFVSNANAKTQIRALTQLEDICITFLWLNCNIVLARPKKPPDKPTFFAAGGSQVTATLCINFMSTSLAMDLSACHANKY